MDLITIALVLVLLVLPFIPILFPSAHRKRIVALVDKLPGPPKLPLFGTLYHMIGVKREGFHDVLSSQNQKYGKLYRVWFGSTPMVKVQKPEHLEKIMANNVHIEKNFAYRDLKSWLGQGILISTGSVWHSFRKLMNPAFHMKILEGFVQVFNEKASIFVDKLHKKADGKVHDIYPLLSQCALDIICETAMNVQVNAMENSDGTYVNALTNYIELLTTKIFKPWLQIPLVYQLSSQGRLERKNLKIIHDFVDNVIQKRKKSLLDNPNQFDINNNVSGSGKKRMAFLDVLLQGKLNGESLTDEDIKSNVNTIMFAGHDTSSLGICWTLILLGSHPEIQQRVRDEINAEFIDSQLTINQMNNMKYTEMVIKEAMRMFSSVPSIGRKLKEDIELDGYTIPAGTNITINLFEAHRDPDVFPNPEVFDPDRFLPENIKERHPYSFVPFSSGPRNCIGQKYGMFEMKVMLSWILKNFKVMAVEDFRNIKLFREFILRPQHGVQVILEAL